MEKTDAQQRNEDEVRRIMRKRGFEMASESKPKKERRDFDFGIIGKVLATIVIVGGLSFCVFALINTLKNDEMVKDASDSNNAAQNTDYAGLAACLNTAYKNHNLISGKLYTTKYERPVMTALFYGSKNMLK